MNLAAGTRLGPYEIVAPLGAGGMGEVYRARDTRLGREVAVKVLPAEVSDDRDRLRRFEQEARAASAIHHPNLLTVFDVGDESGVAYLVTELLGGESLRDLARRGPLPAKRAVEIGVQLARGLAAAHERGVVHRDLKPENLFLTRDGVAKILDFGLARIERPELSAANLQELSTVLETSAGTVLGTVGYMAPEQVRGERADARSDLFALGVVLHELLTGANPFRRDSVIESLNAILKEEAPDLAVTPSGANPALGRIVTRLLEKDPDRRFRSAADLAFALEEADATPSGATTASTEPRSMSPRAAPRARPWLLPVLGATLLAAGIVAGRRLATSSAAGTVSPVHFQVSPPEGDLFRTGSAERHDLAISPDGRTLVFAAVEHGTPRLFVRELDDVTPHELAGTEGAGSPFWSPDSREIAFFAAGKLKRVPHAGGPVQTICDIQGSGTGSWGSRGTIVYAQRFGQEPGLYRIAAGGGERQRIRNGERLPGWPEFLPDGKRFLFWDRADNSLIGKIFLADLDTGQAQPFADIQSQVRYAAPGWLVYVRAGSLVAQRFDAEAAKLKGDPIPLASDIPYFFNGWSSFAVATGGSAIAYQIHPPPPALVWFDRHGRELSRVGPPARYLAVRLSPDGRSAAVTRQDPATGFTDVWVIDVERGGATRLSDEPLLEWAPTWSPDGTKIAYSDVNPAGLNTVRIRSVATGAVLASLPPHPIFFWPRSWSRGGLYIDATSPRTSWDLLLWPEGAGPASEPQTILATDFSESMASVSPDGRWLAFYSNESGAGEIELARPDQAERRIRISRGALGNMPRWRADGRELYYVSADEWLTAISVGPGDPPRVGEPEALFEMDFVNDDSFDVAADGQRFLVAATRPVSSLPVTVALDWQAALPKR